MENRAHAILAVAFLVVFTLAAVLIFFWLTSGPGEPLAYRIVTTESVSGLAPQSKVEFKGLEVGHVSRIRFDPKDRSRVIIDLRLRRDTYITHATYAVAAMQGLTGGEVLQLKLGEGSREPLPTSPDHPALIPMRKGLLAGLTDSAQKNLEQLHAVLADARKVLGADNRAHLAATIRQLDEATARLVKIEAALTPAMQRMPALLASARKSLDESHALIANANQLALAARAPVAKVGSVAGTYQQLGRRLDTQTAPDLGALTQSLTRTSRQLEQLVRQLQARPQSVIFGPAPKQPGPGEPGFDAHEKDHGND